MPTKAHKIDADFGGITLDLAAAQRHVWNSDIASYIELSKTLFNSDEFHEWIRQQNFDIVVSEGVGCYDGLLYMLGIKNIFLVNNKGFSVPMTYMERALNLLEYVFTATIIKYTLEPEFDGYFDQKFGKNAWSMQ
ncbi:hypothetical protein COOONC_25197, partial [Cooperia oncophora]